MGNGRPGSLFVRCLESASLSPVELSSQENTAAVKSQNNIELTKQQKYTYTADTMALAITATECNMYVSNYRNQQNTTG